MPLSSEDALRLNVLLANDPLAIRINESAMSVHALSAEGEARVGLNPNCKDDAYLRQVRELLSGHVMGSPGGYPVFLKRWTRMGQARETNLAQLLLLGEPEAVVAVVGADGLTNELARRAWWSMQDAENARCMLCRDCIVDGAMGPVLADYLVEFLPFEENPVAMAESIRLVLQPGLIDESTREKLWKTGQRKNAYLLGFMKGVPDTLPGAAQPHSALQSCEGRLEEMSGEGNRFAAQLLRTLRVEGQNYLATAAVVLGKPINQDVVNELLTTLAAYFEATRPDAEMDTVMEVIQKDADDLCACECGQGHPPGLSEVLEALPELSREARAMLVLSRLGYPVVRPVFSRSTAIGSLMRKKIQPITDQILAELNVLGGKHA